MAQFRFAPLALKGRESVIVSAIDHLCKGPGCHKYINAGEKMIRKNTHELHLSCAEDWCNTHGVEIDFKEKA